ncbi:hypothetical protein N7488_001963 [Penicillium malachiteum]|nr:hypothetical protein N7488_001963 [Penicillium malachiteum]
MASSTSPTTLSADNLSVLPPILTDSTVKPSPSAKERLSTYSNLSFTSQNRSRPGSHVFPIFHSSLQYALVRDFAYPPIHPMHYGPPPLPSGDSTPASEYRRLSDPPTSWDTSRGPWATGPWSNENNHGHGPGNGQGQGHQQLPAMSFGDGPPYSEDEDLHSPVVTTSRQRKKSVATDLNGIVQEHIAQPADRGTFVAMNPDGSETYYVNGGDSMEDGPGGEYVTYPANEGQYSHYDTQQGYAPDTGLESDDDGDRYGNDYHFAVGCPDEEMHGKAVALFDFTREHENELPLTEGQVIYVSYRHGQGWLVAEDPKTGENGLVPEEFVRLLRDIEGGLTSLNGDPNLDSTESTTAMDMTAEDRTSTPTQNDLKGTNGDTPMINPIEGSNETGETTGGAGPHST